MWFPPVLVVGGPRLRSSTFPPFLVAINPSSQEIADERQEMTSPNASKPHWPHPQTHPGVVIGSPAYRYSCVSGVARKSGINPFQNSASKLYITGWTISQPVARQPLSGDKPLFDILEISDYFISFHIKTGVRPVKAQGLGILEKADLIPPLLFPFFFF